MGQYDYWASDVLEQYDRDIEVAKTQEALRAARKAFNAAYRERVRRWHIEHRTNPSFESTDNTEESGDDQWNVSYR
jgi:hypothetical protein